MFRMQVAFSYTDLSSEDRVLSTIVSWLIPTLNRLTFLKPTQLRGTSNPRKLEKLISTNPEISYHSASNVENKQHGRGRLERHRNFRVESHPLHQ